MRTYRLILIAVSVLLFGFSASAQNDAPRVELFIQGGPSFFTSVTDEAFFFRAEQSLATTGRLFVGGRYYFNPRGAFEASYSYSPNRRQTRIMQSLCPPGFFCPLVVLPPFTSDSMNVHSVAFNYVHYFRSHGRIRPFATGGLGFTVFDSVVFSVPTIETQFTGNFGGGVDFVLTNRVRLRTELRDSILQRPSFAGGRTAHHVTPSAGVAFALTQQDAVQGRPASGDTGPPRVELFVQGGASWFSGRPVSSSTTVVIPPETFTIRTTSGIASTGRVIAGGRYYFTENNAAEVSYAFTPTSQRVDLLITFTPFPPEERSASFSMDVHTFAFNYVRYLTRRGRLGPFVTGGLGFQVFSAFGVGTEFAGNFGGGVDVRLHPRVSLRAELRDFISERPPFTQADAGRMTHNVVPSLGFAFGIR